jgi:hypothetical protein
MRLTTIKVDGAPHGCRFSRLQIVPASCQGAVASTAIHLGSVAADPDDHGLCLADAVAIRFRAHAAAPRPPR